MNINMSEQAKFEQLVHICAQLSQHQSQLITKRQSLQEIEAEHINLAERLSKLEEKLRQKPQSKSTSFSQSLSGYNEKLDTLQSDIQFEKQQQKSRQTENEDEIQRCIRNLGGIELKLRAGNPVASSSQSSQKQMQKAISDLNRTIQRKQLKLKELRIIGQKKYDIRNSPQDSPQQKIDQAHIKELSMKIRALQASIESQRFKKDYQMKAKINELETQTRTTLQQIKRVKTNINNQTIKRLHHQLQQLETEYNQLEQDSQQYKLAIVQIHKQTEQLVNSLHQIQQQSKFMGQDQMLEGLRQKNEAERQQLNFIEATTTNLQKELTALKQQASTRLNKLLGPDNSESMEIRGLMAQIDNIKKLSEECETDLKVNFVPSSVIEQTKRLITAEESALKEIQLLCRKNEQAETNMNNAIKTSELLRNKPSNHIDNLKKTINEQESTIVRVTRQIIEIRDKVQQIREEYNITTEQSIPADVEGLPEFLVQLPSEKEIDPLSMPELLQDENTLEECIGDIIFHNSIPKHQKVLTQLTLVLLVVPIYYILVSAILR